MRKCRTKASSDGLIVGGRNIANGIGRRHRIGIIGRHRRPETTTDRRTTFPASITEFRGDR